jgi:hypothetical protein
MKKRMKMEHTRMKQCTQGKERKGKSRIRDSIVDIEHWM